MFKNIFNSLSGNKAKEEKAEKYDVEQNFEASSNDSDSEYKRLRKQYETDKSCEEQLYEVCKELSIEKTKHLYDSYTDMVSDYNDLAEEMYELAEDAEDDDDAQEAYEKALDKTRKMEDKLLATYDKFLKAKYAERDKLFPEMVERNKKLYEQDLADYRADNEGISVSGGDNDDDEFDEAAYMAQQQAAASVIPGMGSSLPDNSPLLQPIHGISIQDFGAAGGMMLKGMSEADVMKTLGVDKPMWEEASVMWQQRFQQDRSFSLMTLYNQAYTNPDMHPKFAAAQSSSPIPKSTDLANLEKINANSAFYYELAGARQAAINFGYDGAQWIFDNFGIVLEDFQAAALVHMQDFASIEKNMAYQDKKEEEYSAKFAKELGPNFIDDIEF